MGSDGTTTGGVVWEEWLQKKMMEDVKMLEVKREKRRQELLEKVRPT